MRCCARPPTLATKTALPENVGKAEPFREPNDRLHGCFRQTLDRVQDAVLS
jgi:hypothetical protein